MNELDIVFSRCTQLCILDDGMWNERCPGACAHSVGEGCCQRGSDLHFQPWQAFILVVVGDGGALGGPYVSGVAWSAWLAFCLPNLSHLLFIILFSMILLTLFCKSYLISFVYRINSLFVARGSCLQGARVDRLICTFPANPSLLFFSFCVLWQDLCLSSFSDSRMHF